MRGFLNPDGRFYEIGAERHHEWALRVQGVTEEKLVKKNWCRVVVGADCPIFVLQDHRDLTMSQWEWLEKLLYERGELMFDVSIGLPFIDTDSLEARSGNSRAIRFSNRPHRVGRSMILVRIKDLVDQTLLEYVSYEVKRQSVVSMTGPRLGSGHGGTECGFLTET